MNLFDRILQARRISPSELKNFLEPNYNLGHDPFLLPDMQPAVERLVLAKKRDEFITIYGDYDIDGLTATTLLLDAFTSFGFSHLEAFVPNRFIEGYGMTIDAVERIAATGSTLIITVDCGSLSHAEISRAAELGVDVIVTDHHNVSPVQPPAVAVINPKRLLQDHPDRYENYVLKSSTPLEVKYLYPFLDLPGVGVAFKLVQALQTRLQGLAKGQEKWLLDLVALGTVCDVVTLVDENRMHVYWGLKVLQQTRRPGLRALMAVASVSPEKITARDLGFALGPRMNAAGRLETAQYALSMLTATEATEALKYARQLDDMNQSRRREQNEIMKEALAMVSEAPDTPVLVVSGQGWNHGIVGIVAAKLLEKYHKPTFVLAEGENGEAKGSARSYGDFSAADAIRAADDIITKGGGHKLAAGVTLSNDQIEAFRQRVNEFYLASNLEHRQQAKLLLPIADADASLDEIDEDLVSKIAQLEPFGSGNPQPIIRTNNLVVVNVRRMGSDGQHVKLNVNSGGISMDLVAFNAAEYFFVEVGQTVSAWYTPEVNEWNGRRTVEGRLLNIQACL